jgi:hypothetical protein
MGTLGNTTVGTFASFRDDRPSPVPDDAFVCLFARRHRFVDILAKMRSGRRTSQTGTSSVLHSLKLRLEWTDSLNEKAAAQNVKGNGSEMHLF